MNTVQRFLAIAAPVLYTLSSFAAPIQRCPELNSINTHNSLVNNNECAIILYYAPWCSACKGMHSQLEESAKDHYKVNFAKTNLDGNNMKPLRKKLGVQAYPTTIAYKNGQEVRREEGSLSLQEINQMAQQVQQPQQPKKQQAPAQAPVKAPAQTKPQAKKPSKTPPAQPAQKQQRPAPAA